MRLCCVQGYAQRTCRIGKGLTEDGFLSTAPQLLSVCRSGFDVLLQLQIQHENPSGRLEIASLFPDTHFSGIPQLSLSSAWVVFLQAKTFLLFPEPAIPWGPSLSPTNALRIKHRSHGEQTSSGVSELPNSRRLKGKVNCRGDGCGLFLLVNFRL